MADRDSDGEPKEGVPDHAESAGIPISSEDPTTGPRRRRGLWTAEREDLLAALESQNLTCAHLYREAVDALGSADFGVGKLVVAGHAIRELVNLLPVVLADVDLPGRVRDDHLRASLVTSWTAYQSGIASGELGSGLLPLEVANAINEFVQAQEQIAQNALARRAALVLGNAEATDDSSVTIVVRAIKVFEDTRHPGPSTHDAMAAPGAYRHALTVIENAIAGRIVSFFAIKRTLEEIVTAANAKTVDGNWETPSEDDVAAALARVGGMQHRRIFYDQLANPEWVKPLDRHGAFRPPAPPTPGQEQVWLPWPAGDFLVRSAAEEPRKVREILLRTVDENAIWYAKTRLLDAAIRMPPLEAAQMARQIQRCLDAELDPNIGLDLVTLIENLAKADAANQALRLAQVLLRPRPHERSSRIGRREVRAGIDAYWYAQTLQRVVAALATDSRIFKTLYAWLREEQIASEAWEPGKELDFSSIWRPSISDHSQNYRHNDIADALVDTLRDLTIERLTDGADLETVLEILERDHLPIAMRVALHALSTQVETRPDARTVATTRLLDRELMDSPWFHREYTQLGKVLLPLLEDAEFEMWASLVDAGPVLSESQIERITEHTGPGQTLEQALKEHRRYWRHELLSAVGPDALRGRLRIQFDSLVGELGEYEHAGFRSWHSSSFDEEAPISADQLGAMTPDEVIQTLAEWEPDDTTRASARGLAESLRDAVEARPNEFSTLTAELLSLGEPYASRFLDGIRKAAESTTEIDWATFLNVLSELDEPLGPDEDRGSYAQRQVCGAIENATRGESSRIPADLLPRASEVVARYLSHSDPDSDNESFGSDHLTQALNSMRPVAVRTMIRIARAAKLADVESSIVSGSLAALESRIAPRDDSLAVAASFGESLSLLMWLDSDWVQGHLTNLASADQFGEVVVTTALTTNRTSSQLLEDLWPRVDDILDRLAANEDIEVGQASGRTLAGSIGDHLMTLLMWNAGSIWDDRLNSYLARVDAETGASVIGHVGWQLMHSRELSQELLDRAASIWDARQSAVDRGEANPQLLREFYWWVHSRKFPVDWWLPRLTQIADQIDLEGRNFLGEHLEEAAIDFPGEAIALMRRLLESSNVPLARHGLISSAPTVIARGLKSEMREVADAASVLMDQLGEQGIVDMDVQVAKASASLDISGVVDEVDD